jgi:hypothetical protein
MSTNCWDTFATKTYIDQNVLSAKYIQDENVTRFTPHAAFEGIIHPPVDVPFRESIQELRSSESVLSYD